MIFLLLQVSRQMSSSQIFDDFDYPMIDGCDWFDLILQMGIHEHNTTYQAFH
jgi:hypothetical protein